MQTNAKRLGTVAHYIGVLAEYLVVIFSAIWLNHALKLPSVFSLPFEAVGLALAAFGLFLVVWSTRLQFRVGQGTTGFSEPTKKLVTSGPYGIVRNPMMWGQFLFFAGLGFLLDLAAMFLILPVLVSAIHTFTVIVEEPNLRSRFGQEWADYAKRVPRWLPKLGRTQSDRSARQS